MAGNSWDVVESGGSKWYSGKLEMIPVMERTNTYDHRDTSISTTWETVDLSSIIGTDVVGVTGTLGLVETTNGLGIVSVREVGDTTAYNAYQAWLSGVLLRAERTGGEMRLNSFIVIPCKGTDPGKFQVAGYGSWWAVNEITFHAHGRIRS
jgi:hypothetical protein